MDRTTRAAAPVRWHSSPRMGAAVGVLVAIVTIDDGKPRRAPAHVPHTSDRGAPPYLEQENESIPRQALRHVEEPCRLTYLG